MTVAALSAGTPVPIDRRVRRTRASLHRAVVDLVADRGYQAVTVEHIVERADVTRATFYTHFRDKEHLLASVADDLVDGCLAAYEAAPQRPGDPGAHRLTLLFHQARADSAAWRVILRGEGDGAALRRLRSRLTEIVGTGTVANVSHLRARPVVPPTLVVEMAVGEILGVLAWWVERGERDSGPAGALGVIGTVLEPEQVVDWLRSTALYGRMWALGITDEVVATRRATAYREALPPRLRPPLRKRSTP
jgi:AcrR family transcriptional regulator